jgi:hypothetical protein
MSNHQWQLYKNSKTTLHIWQHIQDLDGELPPDLEAALNKAEGERDDIIEDAVSTYKNLCALADLHAAEMKRLSERKAALESRAETLKAWLEKVAPKEGWERGVHRLSWRGSESVEVDDAEKLPIELARIKYEPNKTLLKEVLKAGATVEGCRLVKKLSLQVR